MLLRERGIESSASTVGRIIGYLKRRGELVEPVRKSKSGKRRVRRPYAIRKPRDCVVSEPGDLVQVDTLDVRLLPGVTLKQFTARYLISKWDVVEARSRASSHTAKEFIDTLLRGMPFKVKAIQVDGGSEFYSEFERECECRGIKLFVLPPRSPKLNGCVERAQRTHREEFYDITDVSWTVPELNKELRRWEYVYNCIRPHQALGYKTPLQFLRDKALLINTKTPPLFVSYVVNLYKAFNKGLACVIIRV